jgi:uncharacterized Zn ribbon protein
MSSTIFSLVFFQKRLDTSFNVCLVWGKPKKEKKMYPAKCPNPDCDGEDSAFLVDDLTHHTCDKCCTTWDTYDPKERTERAINIKIPPKKQPCKLHYFIRQGNGMVCEKCGLKTQKIKRGW